MSPGHAMIDLDRSLEGRGGGKGSKTTDTIETIVMLVEGKPLTLLKLDYSVFWVSVGSIGNLQVLQ